MKKVDDIAAQMIDAVKEAVADAERCGGTVTHYEVKQENAVLRALGTKADPGGYETYISGDRRYTFSLQIHVRNGGGLFS